MKLVLASSNKGKLGEISRILNQHDLDIIPQANLGISDAIEDGSSFEQNALIKARHASHHSGYAALADDSGLEVDILKGAPGIRSARFAGEHASDDDNINKLLDLLRDMPRQSRQARFHCVIAMVTHADDRNPVICRGVWEGYILNQPFGTNGFGYDPVFHVTELNCSSASISADTKNRYSHRARALKQLKQHFDSAI